MTLTKEQREVLERLVDDAVEYRSPETGGCCGDGELCEDHAGDQRLVDQYLAFLEEVR